MRIALIVAASDNDVIGKNGTLPWSLPDDLKRFRELTKGHPVIMGRKTWDSLPKKPLPGRRNIVLSRTLKEHPPEGAEVYANIEVAIAKLIEEDVDEVFVIGGEQLFKTYLANEVLEKGADRIELTRVHATIDGDTFLPPIDWSQWKEVARQEHPADDKHAYPFTFLTYERRNG